MLTMITCNLRYDTPEDGANAFPYRRAMLAEALLAQKPDVIGFQEMTPPMRRALTEDLKGYALVGEARGADMGDEANCIAYQCGRLELHELYTLWLSDTPHVPRSRFEGQSVCPRILTAARFYDQETGARFGFYNTHLDHVSPAARRKGLRLIADRVNMDDAAFPLPRFVVGDFNFTPEDAEAALLNDPATGLMDVSGGTGGTFHDFGREPAQKIDYILANNEAARGTFQVFLLHECRAGVYLSDHDPVVARWTPIEPGRS